MGEFRWACDCAGIVLHCWRVSERGHLLMYDSLCGAPNPDWHGEFPSAGRTICESCARTAGRSDLPPIPADAGSGWSQRRRAGATLAELAAEGVSHA